MDKNKVQVAVFYKDTDKKQKFFLLLQTNEKRGQFWQNITGGVEGKESFKEAATREVIEETALLPDNIINLAQTPLVFKFVDKWENQVTEKCFILEVAEEFRVKLDPKEHQDYKWVAASDLTQNSVHYESNYNVLKYGIESK